MFEPLPADFSFPKAEERVLEFWTRHDIFGKSLEQRRGAPRFVFYEGPPTANGLPHPGHCLTRTIKDLFPRYQTMCGKLVERKAGWDTHGLPVEVEVCKELGIHTKEEIERYGVEKFVRQCIESVFRYTREWEQMTRRLGFWVNLEDAYVTYHQSYVESVWWSLKTLFDRGLLYQGHKVVWWWAQGGTALSAGEVGEGYRTVQDPSVYVRFPLRDEPHPVVGAHMKRTGGRRPSLLVWTTTPWTLISNHFVAVGPEVDYSLVRDTTTVEYFYVASALVGQTAERTKHKLETVTSCKGKELVGLRYMPPFDTFYRLRKPTGVVTLSADTDLLAGPLFAAAENADLGDTRALLKDGEHLEYVGWRVVDADFVATDTGTGIVHIAPAYGEVDFERLREERGRFDPLSQIPLLNAVEANGVFAVFAPPAYQGRWVKDCDKDIVRELKDRGILLHQETIEHEYPFCPRAEDDPLIQYARKSWFVRTSQFKEEFLKNNEKVNWLPEHIKEGRFGDFLRNNVDWALSRERYWGTPLPIWVCERCGKMQAMDSLAELTDQPGTTDGGTWERAKAADPTLPDHLRVHKPYVDAWTFDAPCCDGARMRRVPEVIDCWWDAGSMPFAQWGFPHVTGSVDRFRERFPADFISEAIDQTRGWFYGLLAISTLLFCRANQQGGVGVSPALTGGVTPDLTIRRRRQLPHWEAGGSTYLVTFRTATKPTGGNLVELTPEERTVVLSACRHWDGERMLLHAAVVMPDHVHLLFTPTEKATGVWWSLGELLHSMKSFSAKEINRIRSRERSVDWSGTVWQDERYDRIIRDESDFEEKWNYLVTNPQRKGLDEAYLWLWLEPTHLGGGRDAHPTQSQDSRLIQSRDAHPTQSQDSRLIQSQDAHPTQSQDSRLIQSQDAHATPSERDYPHPYRTCIVLGHVMGEDALKMSKRTKNYKEPAYVFDTYGADAMRWYFLSAQVPWTSTRFVEASIRDAQREFLVRLYNVFSFFSIYANIDGYESGRERGSEGSRERGSEGSRERGIKGSRDQGIEGARDQGTGWRPAAERGELDRWIVSELHRTIRDVRAALDRFENYPAAGRLNDFVDALSNWYVRRSRDRFWRGEKDQGKWDAYNTLYEVLLTLSRLLAPFTPFFAETMYQNLTGQSEEETRRRRDGETERRRDAETEARGEKEGDGAARGSSLLCRPDTAALPESVHLCEYPTAAAALIDESLVAEMDLVRDIVSLGRAARTAAKLKVRQPLALVEIILARQEHADWLAAHADLIAEELNIKRVEFTTAADHYVTYQVKPEFKAIGPKFGKLAPKVAAALQKVDAAAARQALGSVGELSLEVEGQRVTLTEHEVHVRLEARPGWSAAQGRAGVVVVQTELTDELRDEGVCRELIHCVQALRKEHDLPYEARITLYVQGPAAILDILRRFAATIQQECLATRIEHGPPPAGVAVHTAKIEGHEVAVALARV